MNKILKYIAVMSLSVLVFACDKDELTGDSTLTPASATVTVSVPNPSVSLIEKDSTFTYTVTLSTPQIVDVEVYLSVTGGDAVEGEDFTMDHVVVIPANRTSATASVKILADEDPEDTETFKIQIGDERTANASITPTTVEFSIMNVTEDDLVIEMSWNVEYYDASGELLDPADVADMILYITEEDGTIVAVEDGAAFESFIFEGDMPDGTYLLKAGIYEVIDPGKLGGPPTLDLTLDASQVGAIAPTTLQFPAAMVGLVCNWNVYHLASITKEGTSYTITRIGEFEFNLSDFTGNFTTVGDLDDEYVSTFEMDDCFQIVNHNFANSEVDVVYEIDPVANTVTIWPQDIFDGAYTVNGEGTFDPETFEITMVIDIYDNDAGEYLVEDAEEVYSK